MVVFLCVFWLCFGDGSGCDVCVVMVVVWCVMCVGVMMVWGGVGG